MHAHLVEYLAVGLLGLLREVWVRVLDDVEHARSFIELVAVMKATDQVQDEATRIEEEAYQALGGDDFALALDMRTRKQSLPLLLLTLLLLALLRP